MVLTSTDKKPRKITLDLILASTSLSRIRSESTDSFLERITHLHLQNKRIRRLMKLEKCVNLKVLYLYDNMIEDLTHLEFAKKLQYLHLENNAIKTIPVLSLANLSKLYLDENEISVVRGLESCRQLEELYIARQRLSAHEVLQFEKASLDAISQTLEVLEISGNNLIDLDSIKVLSNLKKLCCKDNAIREMTNLSVLTSLPKLVEVDFRGNICCSLRRYRDYVIGAAHPTLELLDEMPIPQHQQVAMKGLQKHRKRIGADMSMSVSIPPSADSVTTKDDDDAIVGGLLEDIIEDYGGLLNEDSSSRDLNKLSSWDDEEKDEIEEEDAGRSMSELDD